jgi:hypothetical protein
MLQSWSPSTGVSDPGYSIFETALAGLESGGGGDSAGLMQLNPPVIGETRQTVWLFHVGACLQAIFTRLAPLIACKQAPTTE